MDNHEKSRNAWPKEKLTFKHLDFKSKTSGRPFGISKSDIFSSGISHKCIKRPRIAFSLLEIKTRLPGSMASGVMHSVKKGIVLSMQSFRDSCFGNLRCNTIYEEDIKSWQKARISNCSRCLDECPSICEYLTLPASILRIVLSLTECLQSFKYFTYLWSLPG